ncbi:MAG: PepSY domain-containing protein [Candidatus Hydrothermarchaeales archaeon]
MSGDIKGQKRKLEMTINMLKATFIVLGVLVVSLVIAQEVFHAKIPYIKGGEERGEESGYRGPVDITPTHAIEIIQGFKDTWYVGDPIFKADKGFYEVPIYSSLEVYTSIGKPLFKVKVDGLTGDIVYKGEKKNEEGRPVTPVEITKDQAKAKVVDILGVVALGTPELRTKKDKPIYSVRVLHNGKEIGHIKVDANTGETL